MNMSLTTKIERERTLSEIADGMRKILNEYPEIRKYNVNESGSRGSMGQSAVEIEIYGYDFDVTDALAKEVANMMRGIEGCTEVSISRDEYVPEYKVDFDIEKLARNGIDVTTASMYLRNRINGSVSSYYREDGNEYDIRVRYGRKFRESIEDIENIVVYNNQGVGVKIRDIGEVKETSTPPTIERKDRERYIKVSGIVGSGYALGDITAKTTEGMANISMPAGYMWQVGGAAEDQKETFGDLFMLMGFMIILVFAIMAS